MKYRTIDSSHQATNVFANLPPEDRKAGFSAAYESEWGSPKGDQRTVMIVNDLPDQLELMSYLMRKSGYAVFTALDGREGLAVAEETRPDLIISDVTMPRMDGIEMCRQIRRCAYLRKIPVLLVSAVRNDDDSILEGFNAGADDYLEAPYDPMRLVTKAAQLIERKLA